MDSVDELLAPYREALGPDHDAYRNHVLRVLAFCEEQYDGAASDPRFVTAAVFHDLGIWTAGTWDYLAPSAELAGQSLVQQGREDLVDEVRRMVELHHKVRAAGEPGDAVEVFRRADAIDVSRGVLGFGTSRSARRDVLRRHPNAGFHRRLAQLTLRQLRTDPLHPAPMFRW